jgi:two-component system CheB/CheR fusion protein
MRFLEESGRTVEAYASCEAFLESYHSWREGYILIDAHPSAMKGLELPQKLSEASDRLRRLKRDDFRQKRLHRHC